MTKNAATRQLYMTLAYMQTMGRLPHSCNRYMLQIHTQGSQHIRSNRFWREGL